MKKWIIIPSLALGLAAVASTQTLAEKIPVYLDCKRDTADTTGMVFCAHLGTLLLNPPYDRTVPAFKEPNYWTLHVVATRFVIPAITGGDEDGFHFSILSVTITRVSEGVEHYVTSFPMVTNGGQVVINGAKILAALDKEVDRANDRSR